MIKFKIGITTGDIDGIGLEVTLKSLLAIGPKPSVQFVYFKSTNIKNVKERSLSGKFKFKKVKSLEEAIQNNSANLIEIDSDLSPAIWVEQVSGACQKNEIQALVTGPISKTLIVKSGLKDLGHTDILKRICKVTDVNMGFIGDQFNVVLATGHIPINKIGQKLTIDVLKSSLLNSNTLRISLNKKDQKKPIGIVGLNPHAGENGLIGNEELNLFSELSRFAKKNKIPISEPLVPDAAFFKTNWKKYSVFLSMYHDQGLIPFKMIHGQESGVHVTLGLPIIRTSVDHGTAKDIYGQNKANPNSMIDAITWAIKLARQR